MYHNSIILAGPTATGKTDISILLAKKLNAEIISADSTQIFREINIGTAKITKDQMQDVKHHFIDTKDLFEEYSVGQYLKDVSKILEKDVFFLVVGGTGLYIHAITDGISTINSKDDKLVKELEKLDLQDLVKILDDLDISHSVDTKNKVRVIRAIEIIKTTNMSLENYYKHTKIMHNKNFLKVLLTRDREDLYNRINARVDLMMSLGFLEEAKKIYTKYGSKMQTIKAIGYKEMYNYFEGNLSYLEMIEEIKKQSRRYAKRQITWFKNKGYLEINLTHTSYEDAINIILRGTNEY